MATPAEVLDLVGSLRSGGPVARARTAAEAINTLRSLSVKDKRDLALLVAERTAPQLVPRIQAEGFADLSTEQIEAVVDMVRNLDSDDVDDLKRTFTDPEARDDALRAVGAGLTAAAAATTGPPDVDGDEPDVASVPGDEPDVASVPGDEERAEPPAPQPPPLEPMAAEQAELDRQLAEARAAREQAERDAEAAIEAARAEAERVTDTPAETVPGPDEYDTTVFDELPANTGFDAPEPAAGTAPAAAAASPHSPDITNTPDGWKRRRLVQRLIEDGELQPAQVAATIRLLGSATNRTWLAASAIEAGLIDLDELDDLVDGRAASRLRRRYG